MDEIERPKAGESLTEREWEISRLVSGGMSNPEIAEALYISKATVHTHLNHIYKKLGLAGRVKLALWYERGPRVIGQTDRHDGGP